MPRPHSTVQGKYARFRLLALILRLHVHKTRSGIPIRIVLHTSKNIIHTSCSTMASDTEDNVVVNSNKRFRKDKRMRSYP